MIELIRSIPNYANLTSEEIANTIREMGLTHRPIPIPELLFTLRSRGMLVKQVGPSGWLGSVVRMVEMLPDQAKLPVQIWLSHITDPHSKQWDTTVVQYAQPFYILQSQFKDSNLFNANDFDAVYALGGGLKYETITETEVAAAVAALEKHAIVELTRRAIQDVLTPIQAKSTAVNAWMDVVNLENYTEAELQAYCDSLLASPDGNPPGGV